MNKFLYILILFFLVSCTSNTIFEKPKDLIPKDSMSLLIQEMMIASSAKHIKNINQQKNINYMAFVNEAYNIDSTRFQTSNLYYMSKIDVYEEILTNAKTTLKNRKEILSKLKKELDSLRKDSLKKIKKPQIKLDTIQKNRVFKEALKKQTKKEIIKEKK